MNNWGNISAADSKGMRCIRQLMLVGIICLKSAAAEAQFDNALEPVNAELAAGRDAIVSGQVEEGIRLTERALKYETRPREQRIGMINLCAAYGILGNYAVAITFCDSVLAQTDEYWQAYANRSLAYIFLDRLSEAEADLQKAEIIAPSEPRLEIIRTLLRDRTYPVRPEIVIDDRRTPGGN